MTRFHINSLNGNNLAESVGGVFGAHLHQHDRFCRFGCEGADVAVIGLEYFHRRPIPVDLCDPRWLSKSATRIVYKNLGSSELRSSKPNHRDK